MSQFLKIAALLVLASSFTGNANAVPITWNLDATYENDWTANGSFDFDADTKAFDNIAIDLSGAGIAFTLDTVSCSAEFSNDRGFFFGSSSAGCFGPAIAHEGLASAGGPSVMTNAGGAFTLVPESPEYGSLWNFACSLKACSDKHSLISGTLTSVPEPSIIALFAVALFGLGFAYRRQDQS